MRLLAGAAVALALLAPSCFGGSEEEARTAINLHAELYAERALTEARNLLDPIGLYAETAPDAASADIVVSAEPAENSAPITPRYWAVAVALPYPGRDITLADLKAALTGAQRILVPILPEPPLSAWFPELGVTAVELSHLGEIDTALAADPSALALMPLEAVDAHVRTLAIDGTSVVFGTGDLASYPLAERAYVTRADVDDDTHFAGSNDAAEVLDTLSQDLAAALGGPPPDPIVLRATGDILPVRCALARMRALGDLSHAFRELGPWLAEADVTVGSLDAAISDAGVPFECTETFSLMAPAAAADGFQLAGFDVITVATNHVKDCGQAACGDQAFFDTLANLRSRGIEPVGGGVDLAEARAPAVLTIKGVRFAFLGYDEIAPYYHAEPGVPGTAPLNEAYLREDVAAAAAQADVVIVLPQWGIEYQAEPTLLQRQLAGAAVASGADLIIGNHPHWVEAAEVIDSAFVAYALGNFVFDQDWSLETQQGVVLEAAFHGAQLKGIEYYPVHIWDEHQPRFADPAEAQQILDRIWNASALLQ